MTRSAKFLPFYLVLCAYVLNVLSASLPPEFTHPIIKDTSAVNITRNVTLNNSAGTTYQQMKINDFYIQRLTSAGKL
jgi:hypothetical protein